MALESLRDLFGMKDFNSHTREGVADLEFGRNTKPKISTHTPVRVWHFLFEIADKFKPISTHTPVRVWPDICCKYNGKLISTHTPVRVWPYI